MQDNEMQAVPIRDILGYAKVPVDCFIRLTSSKYILVAKAGAPTPVENLLKYQAKNLDHLFVRLSDYQRMIHIMIQAAEMAVSASNASDMSRLSVLSEALASVYKEASLFGFNETVFGHAKMVNHVTVSFIASQPSLSDLVEKMGDASKETVVHSMMVSLVASMLGTGHDWIKPATLEKLALGGFLHDIGKTKLPSSIVSKPSEMLSRDEAIIYKSHPEIGRQLLQTVKSIPDDILLIVYEHHERSDGSGYPRGIKDFQISPLARVVGLADAFVKQIGTFEEKSRHTARRVMEELEFQSRSQFNKDAMRALHRLLDSDDANRAAG